VLIKTTAGPLPVTPTLWGTNGTVLGNPATSTLAGHETIRLQTSDLLR
jgi:hypothetical protein